MYHVRSPIIPNTLAVAAPAGTGSSFLSSLSQLSTEGVLRGILGLAFFGAGFRMLNIIRNLIWGQVCKSWTVTLEIPSKDESYACLNEWLHEQEYTKKCKQLVVETVYEREDSESSARLLFTPGLGYHFFTYKGKWITLHREREGQIDIALGGHAETITLHTFSGNKAIFKDLIQEAIAFSQEKVKGKIVLYTCANGDWRKIGQPEEPRPMHSIILNQELKDSIISDIEQFIKTRAWYKSLGIPYRRGYLFYGPPGCGKSSFIKALAGRFGLGICNVNLNSGDITDQSLNVLLNETPRKCIIVMEDIDAAMGSRESGPDAVTSNARLTLSGLLNALDGIASQEGRLLFMTTNKKEKLDPALIRPGRADRTVHFGLATRYHIAQFFQLFFPDVSEELSEKFSSLLPENRHSMAELQKYLMLYRESPEQAVENASRFAEIVNEDSVLATKPGL